MRTQNRQLAWPQWRSAAQRKPWLAAAIVLAFFAGALWLARDPLSDRLWPQTRVQKLCEQAAQALAAGRLTAPDGTGARELYQAALAVDPDGNQARGGLSKVGLAALTQARAAATRNDFSQAHTMLQLAQDLSVPRAREQAVANEVRKREAAHAGIDGLLTRAAVQHRYKRLLGDDGALALYQRVLELEPREIQALEGREDALSDLLQQAGAQLAADQLAEAAQTIQAVREYDPGHVELPEMASQLTRAMEQTRRAADTALRQEQLQRAQDLYAAVLGIDPHDAQAQQGRAHVIDAYARRADRAIADFQFEQAQADLERARALQADAASVTAAAQHLQRARQSSRAQFGTQPRRIDPQRLQMLLNGAEAAEQRGDLLTPPGDSAYDMLRAARAIAPNHPQVKQAAQRLLPAAQNCFERELGNNSLGKARGCLDAWSALEGQSAATRAAQRRLATRWLAVGAERLGAGDIIGAQSALQAANTIDAAAPGIIEFRQRLLAAGAGTP